MVARPALRGSLHRGSVPVAIALTVVLALRAGAGGRVASVVLYGACVTAMLAVSGTYHARRFAHRRRQLLRRLDHAMILVATAGTYTAVIVLAIGGATRVVLLALTWALVISGVAVRMLWLEAPRAVVALVYLVAGWQVLVALPVYTAALDGAELTMLAVGGLCYSVGAVVYACRRPDPWPTVFGHHEVFHALVIGGAACQWVAVLLLTA
jgi:hemolysin III